MTSDYIGNSFLRPACTIMHCMAPQYVQLPQ